MANVLREPLGPEQQALLRVIARSFIATGDWPVWQYVELTLENEYGLDAEAALASLPDVGDKSPTSPGYGLLWRPDSYRQPHLDDRIALTVAGLHHVLQADPLTAAFVAMISYLAEQQVQLVPSPREVVTPTVTDTQITERLRMAGHLADERGEATELLTRLRSLLDHEPFLFAIVHQPDRAGPWTVKVPAVLRRYRNTTTVEDYIDTVTRLVTPPHPPSVPPSVSALDLPYAIGYLDAVWQTRTGKRLFVSLDPASVARLTLSCGSEEEFNSLMSALTDVLGQVVVPGTAAPRQRGALEAVRDYLTSALGPDAASRVSGAFETLIRLRRIRVSTQHADARHRAVASFAEIGLAFPPPRWDQAWAHIAALAIGALDAVREEAHAGLFQPTGNGAEL
jgi:hypothetical protein